MRGTSNVPPSFERLALRIGAVTGHDLRLARQRRERAGGSIEDHLIAAGVMDPDLAAFVRAAWVRARALCRRCERRTDLSGPVRGERPCACWSRSRRPTG